MPPLHEFDRTHLFLDVQMMRQDEAIVDFIYLGIGESIKIDQQKSVVLEICALRGV